MTSIRSRMSNRLTRDRVKLEIRRARNPFVVLVGMVVIAVLALSYLVGNLRSSLPWEHPYTVRFAVDDAKGVIAGKQEVRISGVPVGSITKVDLVGGHPVIEATIDEQYAPIYRDARVRLRPRTPLNDLFLDIERRGHSSAGKLDDGQTLPAQRTRTPVDIGRVANVFDADTRPRVKQAIEELGAGLGDHGRQLRAALVELAPFVRSAQRLTRGLAVRRGHTRRLVHNLRVMTQELGHREGELSKLVSGGAASLTELGRQDAPLGATISQLPPTLSRLQSSFAALRATSDELDPALDALGPSAEELPSGLAALRRLTLDARPAVTSLRRPVKRLAPFVRDLNPTAVDLDRAFARLVPQAPRLDRMTAKVVPCELAVQRFFHNTLSVTKFHTGRAAFPRGQLVAGLSILGGQLNDPAQKASPSCAPGGPGG